MVPTLTNVTPGTWVSQIIKSMQQHSISITLNIQGLQQWSKNDIFIMDRVRLFFCTGLSLTTINKQSLIIPHSCHTVGHYFGRWQFV